MGDIEEILEEEQEGNKNRSGEASSARGHKRPLRVRWPRKHLRKGKIYQDFGEYSQFCENAAASLASERKPSAPWKKRRESRRLPVGSVIACGLESGAEVGSVAFALLMKSSKEMSHAPWAGRTRET